MSARSHKKIIDIKYADEPDDFYKILRGRINKHLSQKKFGPFADYRMILKGLFQFSTLLILYCLILSDNFSCLSLFGLQLLFYFFIFLVSVGIAHDASHNAYSSKRWVNATLTKVFDLIGINSYLWELNHIRSHHNVPNVPRLDSAIDSFILFRFHPRADYHNIHRFQHIYILAIYGFATLFKIFFLDLYSYSRKRIGFVKIEQHKLNETLWLIFTKIFVIFYSLIIPAMILSVPFWQFLLGFFAGNIIAGLTLGMIFQVTHVTKDSCYPEPNRDGLIQTSYSRHILRTTCDFCTDNKIITWVAGGLNHHVAHHLFPNISQIHLPEMTKILKKTCSEYDLPYREMASLKDALHGHLGALKQLGVRPDGEKIMVESAVGTAI